MQELARPIRLGALLVFAVLVGIGAVVAWIGSTPLDEARPAATEAPSAVPVPIDGMSMKPTPPSPADLRGIDNPNAFNGIAETRPEPQRRHEVTTYAVEAGDVLWQVAERFNVRSETLVWANPAIDDPDLLGIGQELLVPPADGLLYTLGSDERLSDVVARYGVDLSEVVAANALVDPDAVQAGARLFLPNARPVVSSRGGSSQAQAESSPGDLAEASAAAAPVALPDNLDALLSSGWLRVSRDTMLYKRAEGGSLPLHAVPAGASLERLDGLTRGRILVRDPGDGRTRQAMTGWVAAMDLDVGRAPGARSLAQAYPDDTAMDIAHVFAPYRSQLDASAYAQANCGPATLGMGLDALGLSLSSAQLRAESLNAQRMWGNGVGTLITALAAVAREHGIQTVGPMTASGVVRQWSIDDIAEQIGQGHPVVVQVRYRSLPGRSASPFVADHYILVTGQLSDGRFLYNDAIDADGVGWDRLITPERLSIAMDTSDRRYARSAFALMRAGV